MIGGAPELPNEGWLDAEHVRTIDEKANRRLAHVPADEHVIRGHQGSSGVISGHQGSSVALAWRTSQPMSMSASTVRTSLANVMSNST